MTHQPGTVYLIHFERPFGHARHYLGWAIDVHARLTDHAEGRGARLMQVVAAAGIRWQLVRTWTGGRALERRLKRHGSRARHCPLCTTKPRPAPRTRPSSR